MIKKCKCDILTLSENNTTCELFQYKIIIFISLDMNYMIKYTKKDYTYEVELDK